MFPARADSRTHAIRRASSTTIIPSDTRCGLDSSLASIGSWPAVARWRLCRYALRPPIAHERLHLTPEGQVILDLRHRWADGTTSLVFKPLELLERLTSLTPWPRINLLLYVAAL
jgi:hypothetical protein